MPSKQFSKVTMEVVNQMRKQRIQLQIRMAKEEKNKLDVHISNLHKPSDKLKCKICNSEFTNVQLLENHTNDIHVQKKALFLQYL